MQVDALRKAVTEDDKKKYKEQGRCFFCGNQGHIARTCPKKKNLNPGNTRTAKAEVEDAKSEIALTPEAVLQYLQSLDNHQFDELRNKWEEEEGNGEGSGFQQA